MMKPMPLDDEMIRLKRKAQEREEKLGNQVRTLSLRVPVPAAARAQGLMNSAL